MGMAQLLLRKLGEHVEPTNLKRENIMKEKIDLSLNRSLEELVSSYFEAYEAGFGCDSFLAVNVDSTAADVSDYYVLENYLSDMGAI